MYPQSALQIDGVQFSVLSPEQIAKMSVVAVRNETTTNGPLPAAEGLADPRMGITPLYEMREGCTTCFQKIVHDCPGHIGHIELVKPVFNARFFERARTGSSISIYSVLSCVCYRCSTLLVDKKAYATIKPTGRPGQIRQNLHKIKTKNDGVVKCPRCDTVQPRYLANEPLRIIQARMPGSQEDRFVAPEEVARILSRISNEDVEWLGMSSEYSRPEWMVQSKIVVIPPQARLPVTNPKGKIMEDFLNSAYKQIISGNREMAGELKKLRANPQGNEELGTRSKDESLKTQYIMLTLRCDAIAQKGKSGGRNALSAFILNKEKKNKPIHDRLKGKEGMFRGNMLGKRVDNTARTVIGPGANIGVDEAGAPLEAAMELAYQEVVTEYNIEWLQSLVLNGSDVYPGATKVIRPGDRAKKTPPTQIEIDSRYNKVPIKIEIGDIVCRHMQDGDPILFNRQPTLSKHSIMCHRVRITKDRVFRPNLSVTTAYNADFDGDEMTQTKPESLTSQVEVWLLAGVPRNIPSVSSGKLTIGLVMDTLTGMYKLTKDPNMVLSVPEFLRCIAGADLRYGGITFPIVDDDLGKRTGRDLVSAILPAFTHFANGKAIVVDGEVKEAISGSLIKADAGNESIIMRLWREHGADDATLFIDRCQNLTKVWLMQNSLTLTWKDLLPDESTRKFANSAIDKALKKYEDLCSERNAGLIIPYIGSNAEDEFEKQAIAIFGGVSKDIQDEIAKISDPDSGLVCMIKSGAKGSLEHLQQIKGTVGQQLTDRRRPIMSYNYRVLPCSHKGSQDPYIRGFISTPFILGISPIGMWFANIAARDGLISTHVRTSEVGYLSRRMMKFLEDCKIRYDKTVTLTGDRIVEFVYGDCGLTPEMAMPLEIKILSVPDTELINHVGNDRIASLLRAYRFLYRTYIQPAGKVISLVACDIGRKLEETKDKNNRSRGSRAKKGGAVKTVNKDYVETKVLKLCSLYPRLLFGWELPDGFDPNDIVESEPEEALEIDPLTDAPSPYTIEDLLDRVSTGSDWMNATMAMRVYTMSTLAYPKVSTLTVTEFDDLIQWTAMKYIDAIAPAGMPVGCVSAHAHSHPITQDSISAFHIAGTSKIAVYSGFPRHKEIFHASANIKQPLISIYTDGIEDISETASRIISSQLSDFYLRGSVIYDPFDQPGAPNIKDPFVSDRSFIKRHRAMSLSTIPQLSGFVMRLVIDSESLIKRHLTMAKLAERILIATSKSKKWNPLYIIYSDDNSAKFGEDLVMRIYVTQIQDPNDQYKFFMDNKDSILKMQITGIPDILNAVVEEATPETYYRPENGYVAEEVKLTYIRALGSNIAGLVSTIGIVREKIYSNHLDLVRRTFGIEAARICLLTEMTQTFSKSMDKIAAQHSVLLIDRMTRGGTLSAINRHAINREPGSALTKISFEEMSDMMYESAIRGEYDGTHSVAARTMLGQPIEHGFAGEFELEKVMLIGGQSAADLEALDKLLV